MTWMVTVSMIRMAPSGPWGRTGNDRYNLIEVGAAAVPAHMAHGDVMPGDGGLDLSCSVMPAE